MKIDWRRSQERDAHRIQVEENSCTVLLGAAGGGITVPQLLETKERYLVGEVEILEDHSAAMMFRCYREGEQEPRIGMRFGLLPHLATRICLDLDLLDNRTIFTNRTPGTLKLVVHGQRVRREEVACFELGMEDAFHDVKVRFSGFYTTDEAPTEFPVPEKKLVDEFGQWKDKEWPGKIHSLEELKAALHGQEGKAAYPFPEWNEWGGDSGRKLKEGTGFFSPARRMTADGISPIRQGVISSPSAHAVPMPERTAVLTVLRSALTGCRRTIRSMRNFSAPAAREGRRICRSIISRW